MTDPKAKLASDARSLTELDGGILRCRACPLWERATQAVCGEGGTKGGIMLVGEQPGDQEDLTGKPFVGPAGKVLDDALAKAGIDRGQVYVTNAVKHFSWEPRGKRRMHKTPAQQEVAACLDWLLGEIRLLSPRLIVCLGGQYGGFWSAARPEGQGLGQSRQVLRQRVGTENSGDGSPIVDPAHAAGGSREGVRPAGQGSRADQGTLKSIAPPSPARRPSKSARRPA